MPIGPFNNLKEDTMTSGVKGVVVANPLLKDIVANPLLKDIANIRGPEGGSTPTELATLLKDAELKFNLSSASAPHDGSHLSQLFLNVGAVIKGRTLAAAGGLLSRSLDFFVALAKGIAPGVGAVFDEGPVPNSKKRKAGNGNVIGDGGSQDAGDCDLEDGSSRRDAGCTLHISRVTIRVGRANGDKAQIDEARGRSFHSLVSGGWSAIKICCVWAAAASNHTDYVLPLDHVRIAVEARAKILYTVLVVTHVDANGRSLGQYAALMLVHAAAGQANLQSHGFDNGRPLADLIVPAAAARELDPAWLGEQRFKVESSSHSNACFSCGNALPDLSATVECMIIKGVSPQAFAPRDVDAAPGLADAIKYTCARLVMGDAYPYPLSCVITADFQVTPLLSPRRPAPACNYYYYYYYYYYYFYYTPACNWRGGWEDI
ncbi:hypothetical protein T492DRAFT_347980 [Pavlovales sp. CCMP2436]|nr:hypothetical protein T492DRAFT_347980 [Pavlovales sp. CCMP2436]